jgi:HSP20 family molecular chaperone IbpA
LPPFQLGCILSREGRRRDVNERRQSGRRPGEPEPFDRFVTELWEAQFGGRRHGFSPAVDSYRTDDPAELVVVVELPGVDPDQVQIVLHDRTLIIAGERIRPKRCGRRYHQMEIEHGSFQRRIHIYEQVDADSASATYERGMLRIVLPLSERSHGAVRVPIELRSKP